LARIEFQNPLFLLLFIPYAAMLFWYFFKKYHRRGAAFALSSESIIIKKTSLRSRTYRFMPAIRFLSILFLIIALARPGKGVTYTSVKNLGIDIMIALDVSGSMQAEDFKPSNRLTVAKKVVKDFILKRKADRIGLVVFAKEAYLQCPLVIDHEIIADIVDEIEYGTVDPTRTAVGDGVSLCVSRLMERQAKSRIILLLTDGANNSGSIDPETAAQSAAELGIRIYSVGIGIPGVAAPMPGTGNMALDFFFQGRRMVSDLDIDSLKKISEITSGRFYNATSTGVFWENIQDIDRLEKSEAEVKVYHEFFDRFRIFIALSACLFFLEILLKSAFYRKMP